MKTALTLAGGGSRGAYQAGSIKALRELGYEFDIVTGTSIGALNGLLVLQEDYEALYHLWETITIHDVMTYPIDFNFSIDSLLKQANLITSFFKSYLHHKGADIQPLVNLIHSLYNKEKAIKSSIDYGIVTVCVSSLLPVELQRKDMTKDNLVEYAIASASCFPAFPMHKVDGEEYIDGGYYDNLPVSLAMKMGAEHIIAIDLTPNATHAYFLDRPSITYIRPYRDLGNFLDFSRKQLDQRIQLGYLDTYKMFNKYKGFTFTFSLQEIPLSQQLSFYDALIKLENKINHVSPRVITENNTPLTSYLLQKTHKRILALEDYTLLALETLLDIYEYPYTVVYEYARISDTVIKQVVKAYKKYTIKTESRAFSMKKFVTLIKDLTTKEAVFYIYHTLVTKQNIDKKELASMFPQAYIIALYMHIMIT